jgi:hypothetical protein
MYEVNIKYVSSNTIIIEYHLSSMCFTVHRRTCILDIHRNNHIEKEVDNEWDGYEAKQF